MRNQIVVICNRPPHITHARVTVTNIRVKIEYGFIEFDDLTFKPHSAEELRFIDHPELRCLHDFIAGWNVSELAALVNDCCAGEKEMAS